MKAFWKVLGLTALAAFVPVRIQKDEETGRKKFQSLLLSVDVDTDEEGNTVDIGVNLGEGVLTELGRKAANNLRESEMFTDDPAEAAVDPVELQAAADEAQAAADDLKAAADEAQAAADDLKAAADEAQAVADEASAADFDPEF